MVSTAMASNIRERAANLLDQARRAAEKAEWCKQHSRHPNLGHMCYSALASALRYHARVLTQGGDEELARERMDAAIKACKVHDGP